ncbi:hypothetical protein C8R44DRAFT_885484 [Mycena epipterygia]|nr:hypothetical protein C8R44DRAFT_885484 [Mycena epipterygia]
MAAGADFTGLPCIGATLGTVLIVLQTVDKLYKNRDDVKDLCASIVEIVFILRDKFQHTELLGLFDL